MPSLMMQSSPNNKSIPCSPPTIHNKQHKQQNCESQRHQKYSEQLTTNPNFLGNRSPFYETISRHCVMPICQKQLINFQFNLPQNYVSDIKNGLKAKHRRRANDDGSTYQRVLHIRLFDLSAIKHVAWNCDDFILKINKKQIKLPRDDAKMNGLKNKNKKRKKMGAKAKGFSFILPLDISKYALSTMNFEIHCLLNVFHGAASIEIVNVLTTDEVAAKVIQRSELASTLHRISSSSASSEKPQCKICSETKNLSRCSRCKAVWYCSKEHQEQDWDEHHLGCLPFEGLNRLKLTNNHNVHSNVDDDDHVICDEIKVSIKDPLSLCRICIPIRGVDCHHPQCVDLRTYLNYCHAVKLWQCPICMNALKYDNLVVDKSMNKILSEVDDDVDQVRLNPDDYSYKVVTLKEMQDWDGMTSQSVSMSVTNEKKRKLSDDNSKNNNGVKKKRKIDDVIVLD